MPAVFQNRWMLWCAVGFFILTATFSLESRSAQTTDRQNLQNGEVLHESLLKVLAQRLYQNECAGRPENLVYWSKDEPFPSLGIAHFIWLPKSQQHQRFIETFPAYVLWYRKQRQLKSELAAPPDWLKTSSPFYPPWNDRKDFQRAMQNPDSVKRIEQLRRWLHKTQRQQAEFVVVQFRQRLAKGLASLPDGQRHKLESTVNQLMQSPAGLLAVWDYSNFKGLGNNVKEQYQGQGWGLIEVLQTMLRLQKSDNAVSEDDLSELSAKKSLAYFIQAAKIVLRNRVALAPRQSDGGSKDQRWLAGWEKRVSSYASGVDGTAR